MKMQILSTAFTNRPPLVELKISASTREQRQKAILSHTSPWTVCWLTTQHRQVPGVHLDAHTNSDPSLHRPKQTDAEPGGHTKTHIHSFTWSSGPYVTYTQTHCPLHTHTHTTTICNHTLLCVATLNYRRWQGGRHVTHIQYQIAGCTSQIETLRIREGR